MKTNRQNKPCLGVPCPAQKNDHRLYTTKRSRKRQHKSKRMYSLAALMQRNGAIGIVNLGCRGEITWDIQVKKDSCRVPFIGKMGVRSEKVFVQTGQSKVMHTLMENYSLDSEKVYIFSAKLQPREQVKSFRTSHSDFTKNPVLAKTASEKELRFPSAKKTNQPKVESETNLPCEGKDGFKRYLSNKNLGNPQSNGGMFIVEQLKESMQSEPQASLKSNKNKENLNMTGNTHQLQGLEFNKNDQLMDFRPISFAQELKGQQKEIEFMTTETLSVPVVDTKKLSMAQNAEKRVKLSQQRKCEQIQVKEIMNKKESFSSKEPGFSFTSNIRKGLIEGHSVAEPQMSFKIAGDEDIEAEKGKSKVEMDVQSLGQIDELSSIISNVREDVLSKQVEQQQIDSIHAELESLNNCMKKGEEKGWTRKSNKCNPINFVQPIGVTDPENVIKKESKSVPKNSEFAPVQRLDLNLIAHQREQHMDDQIQISEKPGSPSVQNGTNQFQVKYNVRFLAKKGEHTEVVRLSPLRFRRKQQLVNTFLKARMIPKQSSSIIIP